MNVAPPLLGVGGGDRIHHERLHHVHHPVQVQSQVSALQAGPEADVLKASDSTLAWAQGGMGTVYVMMS